MASDVTLGTLLRAIAERADGGEVAGIAVAMANSDGTVSCAWLHPEPLAAGMVGAVDMLHARMVAALLSDFSHAAN